ncbi:hypothetical protein ACFVWG_20685 [Kribbella sp. NPDC058245]|uniref:hypothetical protein n=1 Tax=Kribbella sp. NPDC058245 TaxID=3346399 RepID=UPI0036E92826
MSHFHERLDELRAAAGMPTYRSMGVRVNVPVSKVREWFDGQIPAPEPLGRLGALIFFLEVMAAERGQYVPRGPEYWQQLRSKSAEDLADDSGAGDAGEPESGSPIATSIAEVVPTSGETGSPLSKWDVPSALAFVALVAAVFQITKGMFAVLLCVALGSVVACGIAAGHAKIGYSRLAKAGYFLFLIVSVGLFLVDARISKSPEVFAAPSAGPTQSSPLCEDVGSVVILAAVHANTSGRGASMEMVCTL